MAWHEGKPEYRSSPNSKEVRENFAYLKALADLLSEAGVTEEELSQLHGSGVMKADLKFGFAPVGSIVAYVPGYFTNSSNAGFTYRMVSANTVAAVNALLNPSGWYVCNGAALNDADSGIFNGAGRYLPNLTDDRFFMGDTVAGGIGGANTMAHTHTTGNHTLTMAEMPKHRHYVTCGFDTARVDVYPYGVSSGIGHPGIYTAYEGSNASHNHGATGAASNAENRPSYLSCFYIMRVK